MSEYRVTYDQCKEMIHGVCSRCGGELEPIETVDNSGNPTFWQGCISCSCFDSGVTPEIYKIAKEMVEKHLLRPYSHPCSWASQISGACDIVWNVLKISKEGENGN